MAPTGRAAKVLQERTGAQAVTVHKSIYSYDELVEVEDESVEGGKSFLYYYKLRNNADLNNEVFIVDEASMLSDTKQEGEFFRFGSGHLLSDLIEYTGVARPNAKTQIIFVGDPCQLPPVGDSRSRAFDKEYLNEKFRLKIMEAELREVRRQKGTGGLLAAASTIRKSITSGYYNSFSLINNHQDIHVLDPDAFLAGYGEIPANKIIVASKNKTCLELNQDVRERRFGNRDAVLQKGDIVISGGNNYRKGIMNGASTVV